MSGKVLVRREFASGVARLTLDSPPANGYTHAMMLELDAAVLAARFDPSIAVILLDGAGEKMFCAGADIEALKAMDPDFKDNFCLHANETLSRLEQTPKLVIAALNGHAVGGGLEVALAADLRIARAGGGKVGLPEVKLGVLPGTGGTQRLARIVGKARALEMMLTGQLYTFEEAAGFGLIHAILPAEEFTERALEYARAFTPPRTASRAVGLIKRAVQSGVEMGMGEGLALERELQSRLFRTADAQEGLAANRDKRPPSFRGV
jgi:enoyl-CoA hydratase/carnithine racemase